MAQTGYTPILIYSSSTTTNAPAVGNLTNSTLGSELAINITDGKLFYKDNANAIQVIGWKTTPTTAGGTGLTSYTAGDMVYYASGTVLSKLAIGASGRYLSSTGSAPQWSAPAALTKTDDTNVTLTLGGSASTALLNAASLTLGWTGQLAATRGGTGLGSYAVGDLLYADTTTSLAKLADVATGNALISGGVGVAPSWGKIGLTTHVSGTLPVANGGTNLTSYTAGDLLYATGATTLAKLGVGTSNQVLTSTGSAPQWSTDLTIGKLTWSSKLVLTGNGSSPGASELAIGTNGVGSRLNYNVATGGEHDFTVNGNVCIAINNTILAPVPDNTLSLGNGSLRWTTVYATTALINTSDANSKQQIKDLSVSEAAVAQRIKKLFKTFKFNDSVAEKGDGARIHIGVVAQDVKAAFEAEGLDPNRYGLFCYDQWNDSFVDEVETQIVIENGEQIEKSVPTGKKILERAAGSRYGVRYEELLAFVIAAM
jgi:hypothetical protein